MLLQFVQHQWLGSNSYQRPLQYQLLESVAKQKAFLLGQIQYDMCDAFQIIHMQVTAKMKTFTKLGKFFSSQIAQTCSKFDC